MGQARDESPGSARTQHQRAEPGNRLPRPHAGPGDDVLRVRATALNYHDSVSRGAVCRGSDRDAGDPRARRRRRSCRARPRCRRMENRRPRSRRPDQPRRGRPDRQTVHGGLAEYCRLRAQQLVAIPDGIGFEEAAALPCTYGTARRMMFTNGRVSAGEKVLILGASGGVGVC
jgi:alcohol dehydrogenase